VAGQLGFRFWEFDQDSGLAGLEFDGLCPGGWDELLEDGDRMPLALSRLIPLQVVASFRVVFLPAVDQDMIPDYFAFAFDDRSEGPPAIDLDHLDDVDAICVRLSSSHFEPPGTGSK
jgi:hypothetical protein